MAQDWEADQTAVRSWEELNTDQRQAATLLGYTANEWDSEMRGSEPPPDNGRVQKFADGEEVLAYDSSGKCMPAKVLQSRRSTDAAEGGAREYKVHYRGWSSKWDCWVGTAAVFKKTVENIEAVRVDTERSECATSERQNGGGGQKRKRSSAASIEERLAERRRAVVESPARSVAGASQTASRVDLAPAQRLEESVASNAGAESSPRVAAITSPPRSMVWDENSQSYEPATAAGTFSSARTVATATGRDVSPKHQSCVDDVNHSHTHDPKSNSLRTSSGSMRLVPLPAALDAALASELQFIVDDKRQLMLPRSPSADTVLARFVAERQQLTSSDAIGAQRFADQIRAELRNALGTKLLYSTERAEYERLKTHAEETLRAEQKVARASTNGATNADTKSAEQQRKPAVVRVKQHAALDVLISQTYGAQHLLRLLVAVPSLRHDAPEAAVAAADTTQPASKRAAEVEHFIGFLAKHTGTSEWLGDGAAYKSASPREAASSKQDGTTNLAQGTSVAIGTTATSAPSKSSDWRGRALHFLSDHGDSVDGDL